MFHLRNIGGNVAESFKFCCPQRAPASVTKRVGSSDKASDVAGSNLGRDTLTGVVKRFPSAPLGKYGERSQVAFFLILANS
jgi:hypothetical protein